jgi:acetyl-CoA C-acetyltransferase
MKPVFLCDSARTPIGRYGGALSTIRADDLAAAPIRALMSRFPLVDWALVDEVVLGAANQAGEDNRNVARIASLLAGLPVSVPGVTVNRLCGSGLEAIATGARLIAAGQAALVIAGGVESMSRAPYVMPKAEVAHARDQRLYDTTIGWRLVNAALEAQYGVDSMPDTAENVAALRQISRQDQDAFALGSQQRAVRAQASGRLAREIVPVVVAQRRGDPIVVDRDEHPRHTSLEALARLPALFRKGGTVTAGNAAGINDGACAVILADEATVARCGFSARARIVDTAAAGVEPRLMGLGPVPAIRKVLARTGVALDSVGVIELNEAFAAQALGVLRDLGLPDDAEHVNPNGGAIALGHPLGMSGARIAASASLELESQHCRWALCSMCIGVGQGIAMVLERAG